jgi:DNA polymerase-4
VAVARSVIEAEGLTLIGLALSNLDDDGAVQLTLPFSGHHVGALDATLDTVRDKFGSTAITRAMLLGRDEAPSVPLLPD